MKVIICNKFKNRLFGLMFKIKKIDYALCFPKCNSIHTFFMFQPIDVVMTTIDHKIIKIYKNLKPWRVVLPKKNVYYTYEFPIGYSDKLKENDILKISQL